MPSEYPDEMEAFERWLLRRVAQAVEGGEVSVALLAELRAEIEAARELPQEVGHAAAVRQIADLAGVSETQAAESLAPIEALPSVTRELLMRRFAEAWLEGQRKAYREQGDS